MPLLNTITKTKHHTEYIFRQQKTVIYHSTELDLQQHCLTYYQEKIGYVVSNYCPQYTRMEYFTQLKYTASQVNWVSVAFISLEFRTNSIICNLNTGYNTALSLCFSLQ